jgi:hypothetical protein
MQTAGHFVKSDEPRIDAFDPLAWIEEGADTSREVLNDLTGIGECWTSPQRRGMGARSRFGKAPTFMSFPPTAAHPGCCVSNAAGLTVGRLTGS